MKNKQIIMLASGVTVLTVCLLLCFHLFPAANEHNPTTSYIYPTQISSQEQTYRSKIVSMAESFLGYKESNGTHREIIDIYNAHIPLAVNYKVQYTDEWCATFGSAVAIKCNLTKIIPTECGCERQIQLFQDIGCWIEDDAYIPLPGDYIFYHTGHSGNGDCADWSDHVGIVVYSSGDTIKVIEGNYLGSVRYRTVPVDDVMIRGFGVPDYSSVTE